ncbi:hypothetical protein MP228_009241 [Amoeboaphelidium protococcarum]|nr:hypothetical protein MP228_009241 [Amoeboaphelidium protococcarum]
MASRLVSTAAKNTSGVSSVRFNAVPLAQSLSSYRANLYTHSSSSSQEEEFEPFTVGSKVGNTSVKSFNTRLQDPFRFGQQRFYSSGRVETTRVPDFSSYKKSSGGDGKKDVASSDDRAFTYMMIGSAGVLGAVGAKNFVATFLSQLAPSADVMALAKTEIDLTSIPQGKNLTVKWRGKPVVIRHRTQDEISEANTVAMNELRDPQSDADRVKKPEWLVVLAICTHLGCVPIGEAGDYDGWYCPCHGSHYDISGRIRKGPAPLNLEVPPYEFIADDTKLVIG